MQNSIVHYDPPVSKQKKKNDDVYIFRVGGKTQNETLWEFDWMCYLKCFIILKDDNAERDEKNHAASADFVL